MNSIDEKRNLKWLEDRLKAKGIPSYCHIVSSNERDLYSPIRSSKADPIIACEVFNSEYASRLWSTCSEIGDKIYSRFGTKVQIFPNYIHYYMSYIYFGSLSSEKEGFFLSTKITNMNDPNIVALNGGTNPVYHFNIDIVAVGISRRHEGNVLLLSEEIKKLANRFNHNSRFLKIGQLRLSCVQSRIVHPDDPPLRWENIEILGAF